MNTESLRLFVLAADRLNISAAGRALGMAPAVASARLAKLEHRLGADLLHRSTRKVALSQEGAEFLPYAREILAQEDAGRAALGLGKPQVTGRLRFTAPSTFAQQYIAPLLPEFLSRYPDVTLDLRLSDAPFDLIEGSFDLALRNMPLQDTSLKGRKLADDRRILCASPDYIAQNGTLTSPDDLANHALIAFASATAKQLTGPLPDAVFDPQNARCRLIMDDGLSQKVATLSGAGISVNSLWSVHEELANGTLVHILPEYHVAEQTALWLVYPKANVLSAKVRVFMDFLLEGVGKSPVWNTW